jgi:hypothetical protein
MQKKEKEVAIDDFVAMSDLKKKKTSLLNPKSSNG